MGVDFGSYLDRVLQDVRQNWCSQIPQAARPPQPKQGKVVLEFAILKDGSVAGLRVAATSGDIALDRPAYGSITGSNPFPPPPTEFKGPYLGLRIIFYYNRHSDDVNQGASLSCPSDYVSNQLAQAAKAPEKASAPGTSEIIEAATLYHNGRFDEAAKKYQHLLEAHPKLADAYAGLARVCVKQRRLQEAHDTISKGLTLADSTPIHVALGELLFREGKLPEAENEWLNVLNTDPTNARAHLGLAWISTATTQYKQARAEIDKARALDPNDLDIQAFWTRSLMPSGQTTCRVSADPVPVERDLLILSDDRPNGTRGYGLAVALNGQNARLQLDTGSHGIIIDRKLAQKAGLTRMSDTKVGGFGDRDKSTGYFAIASSIKLGVLEFRDCTVTVIDKRSVLGQDGLIGTDVFDQYLINLDFPNKKLRLGNLPKRPDEDLGRLGYLSTTHRFRPADFSFSFTPVYRFGHLLLLPTQVGDSPDERLFAIDTGAPRNVFSVSAARQISSVQENSRVEIKGLSGSVRKVYDAEKTALHFANVQQYADKETALNLEGMSDEVGTEVSGVLGVLNLRTLDVILDYRDGFVAFDFTLSLWAQVNAPPQEPKPSTPSQIEEAAKKPPSQQDSFWPVEVLSDTRGVDFNPYLSRVIDTVKEVWYRLIPESLATKQGKVVLEFTILKDGSVAGLKVVKSSGEIALDRPAYGSITSSSPFPPLPSEFTGPYLGLRFSFYYNLAPRSPRMFSLVEDVLQKHSRENPRSDKNAKIDLEHDVAALTKLLDDRERLDAEDDAGARFFRALANTDLNFLRRQDGVPPDIAAAEQALNDLDRIIAGKSDIPAWHITIPDVEYYAGAIAWNELRSDFRAYSYWQRCADSAHAGCMSNLAGAYITGWGGVQPNPAKALDLNLRAFDTGNKNVCAGAYAAVSIAGLIHFMGVSYPKDNDPVSWIHKSYTLFDAVESRPNNKDTCGGSRAHIDEFLYRLSRGDRQNDLLTQAARYLGNDSTTRPALINYFSGSLDVKAFEAAVESSKSDGDRCYAYFHAMWYAYLSRDTALVNKFYALLLKLDPHTCSSSLVYARKFLPEGTQSHPPEQPR
jgi:TonB family protein